MSAQADRDPDHLYPEFWARLKAALDEMRAWCAVHSPGVVPELGEGFRSTERQQELFKKHPRVTYKDGVVHKSNHQSSMAADLWLRLKTGGFDWDERPVLYAYWGHCVRAQGLKWGGDWKSFKDNPHVEWDTADLAAYRKAREWQKTVGLV